jgi:hypothetical protein
VIQDLYEIQSGQIWSGSVVLKELSLIGRPQILVRSYKIVSVLRHKLSYLGNFLRRFALPKPVSDWSLRSVQLKLIKIGAKVVSRSRRTTFQCAEVAVSEKLFAELLERIHGLAAAPT